ncbi:para-aminobenzoate synthetase component 1 [Bacillus horti]|uniref:Para-aminobenzoate synthetase component 1 n=1 Tax=Caldalkalibacillus horti TaxID=77523 RepID=A0ABT9W2Z6_9BACI|nr:anthranilate synthase component I family protein [Bacillus horti]MDQ0167611.1 para-aminobenzoate synthetase component 1 [Bacillus horti]
MFKPTLQCIQALNIDEFHSFTLMYPLEMSHDLWFPLYQEIKQQETHHMILESGRAGRYSVIGYRPVTHIVGKDGKLTYNELSKQGTVVSTKQEEGELLDLLKAYTEGKKAYHFGEEGEISAGLFGYYSYDLVREIEELPKQSTDDLHTPDVNLMEFEQLIVFDHTENQHWLLLSQELQELGSDQGEVALQQTYEKAQNKLLQWNEELQSWIAQYENKKQNVKHEKSEEVDSQGVSYKGLSEVSAELPPLVPSLEEPAFVQAVEKIQQYIAAGDVFQVNLSVRQARPLYGEPLDIYRHLRQINPSPYMGYLHFPEQQVICGSPEQLIKLSGQKLSTRPIAGTRPRGGDREQDLKLAHELIHHPKERAEHVMLVDLERNDLGKVAAFGTVHVDEFMVIEEYSHVMHIVSNVQGELAPEYDAFDVIRAVFPGGTITGAPKVRTMEIIEELEPVRRGVYTGAIGWISFAGAMELNITIRTMLVQQEQVYVQAGAGIVIDSVPQNEYQESLNKAKALWKAYELSVTEWKQSEQSHKLEKSTEETSLQV